jgi:hypothetical protein
MRRIFIGGALLIALICGAIWFVVLPRGYAHTTCPSDPDLLTAEQWIAKTTFPYAAAPERKSRIITEYPQLSLGMSKGEVRSLIGDPDYEGVGTTKSSRPKCLGNDFVYYVAKPEDLVNEKNDQMLYISFSLDNKVEWITSSIPGQVNRAVPPQPKE